ncbi:MAG: hypothetical protein ACXVAV_14905, partial [Ktedonobacteraceae bacterium]
DQILTKECVGVDGADRACAEPEREQHQDRWETEHLGDQRCHRRQDDYKPEFKQGLRLAERRHGQRGKRVTHTRGPFDSRSPTLSCGFAMCVLIVCHPFFDCVPPVSSCSSLDGEKRTRYRSYHPLYPGHAIAVSKRAAGHAGRESS